MRRSHIEPLPEEKNMDFERSECSGSSSLPVLTWPPITLRDIFAPSTSANPYTSSVGNSKINAEQSYHYGVASSTESDSGPWYLVSPNANRSEQTGSWVYSPSTPSIFAEGRTSAQYGEAVEKRLRDEVMEPRSDLRSHATVQVLEALGRMKIDTIIESAPEESNTRSDNVYEYTSPPGTAIPLPKWTMPRNKIYRDAFAGASSKLSDSDIESMMNSGELIEDSIGIRYASTAFPNPYILHDLGKGKKPEDSTNLKLYRVKEHSRRTLSRVNIEGEEVVERAGSPIVDRCEEGDGDEEMVQSSKMRAPGGKMVQFWAWKDTLNDDWELEHEVVVDNEKMKGEKAKADWKGGRRKRRRRMREEEKCRKEAEDNRAVEDAVEFLRE